MKLDWMKWGVPFVVAGLVGCGEDTFVYDVEMDAAALSDVSVKCTGDEGVSFGGPAGIAAQQRWTLRTEAMRSTSLELPDIAFDLPLGRYDIDDDDAPDVLMGTSSEAGPLQFVDMRTEYYVPYEFPPHRRVLRISMENDDLGADTLQGYIWMRDNLGILQSNDHILFAECITTIPFTGRRVKE